jgi:tetratricopeptide (TPR) repeat protein
MGLFDFLFGSRDVEIPDPDRLRAALFESAAAGDRRRMEKLCRANRQAVLDHFADWQKPPDTIRDDQAGMQRYVHGLITVAELFAHRLGAPELLQRLTGGGGNNPLVRWQEQLARARQLMADLAYPEARDLLTDVLIDVRQLKGTGVDAYLPVTLGLLGECYFQCREAEKGLPHLEQALSLCQSHGDSAGIIVYLTNLYEAHRYLGRAEPAADYARRLAEALENEGRAAEAFRYHRQEKIVHEGEPLNRVLAVVDGATRELDEVAEVEGKHIRFIFQRNRPTLRPAVELVRRGEELGRQGSNDEALALFRDAGRADPFDPHARYLEGFSLLLLGRPAEAVECYQSAEELAPGWFHCRSNLWLAQQMALGKLGHEIFLGLAALEDGPQTPEEKVRLADMILSQTPTLAPVHLLRGKNLARLGRDEEARAAYQAGLACAAEPDVKTRLLVELGVVTQEPKRTALFREAVALGGNLVAAATAVLALKVGPAT